MIDFDVSAYLARIGLTNPPALTVEGLEKLTRAHLRTVPFENLALTEDGVEPSLEVEDLFRKIVLARRGGYCFELNKLYHLLLEALGFECRSVAARVINNRPEPCPISHRAIIVVIDGKRYFCDVGFGGAGPKGVLPLDEGAEQTVAGEKFHLSFEEDGIAVCRYEDGTLWRVMKFRDEPWLDVDFNTLNRYYAAYHGSPFRLKRILYLCTEGGWISLVQNTFTSVSDGVATVTELASSEIPELIRGRFLLDIEIKDQG